MQFRTCDPVRVNAEVEAGLDAAIILSAEVRAVALARARAVIDERFRVWEDLARAQIEGTVH